MGSGSSARRASQPIQALNPYNNGWTIKARVANKGQMRSFSNKGSAGGTTSLFSVELVDEQARCLLNTKPQINKPNAVAQQQVRCGRHDLVYLQIGSWTSRRARDASVSLLHAGP